MDKPTQPEQIIMYGTPSCPMVPPMRGLLNRTGVDYQYINILKHETARERVRTINDGYESVPTFVFPDDSTLTEPSAGEMRRKLEHLGYDVPLSAMLMGNLPVILLAIGAVVLALLRIFGLI